MLTDKNILIFYQSLFIHVCEMKINSFSRHLFCFYREKPVDMFEGNRAHGSVSSDQISYTNDKNVKQT